MRVILSVLRVHVRITISILDKLSDGGGAKACRVAILSDHWFCEFQFVDWAATELHTFRSWGNSCPCHQYEWFHNIKTTCARKGQLLCIAWAFITDFFKRMVATAESWTTSTWGLDHEFLQQVVGGVRAVTHRGLLKFVFIDCIPFMLSRLGLEEGIRERAIVQFKSQPKVKQLKRSILLLDDGSELRALMDAMPHSLAHLHPDLSVLHPRDT